MPAPRPVVRRLRRLALLAVGVVGIAAIRDRLIGRAEQREGDRLGLGDR